MKTTTNTTITNTVEPTAGNIDDNDDPNEHWSYQDLFNCSVNRLGRELVGLHDGRKFALARFDFAHAAYLEKVIDKISILQAQVARRNQERLAKAQP